MLKGPFHSLTTMHDWIGKNLQQELRQIRQGQLPQHRLHPVRPLKHLSFDVFLDPICRTLIG